MFGSQTGTAQNFAEEMCQLAHSKLKSVGSTSPCTVHDLHDFDFRNELLPSMAMATTPRADLVFVVACYGAGEPTDSAKPFFKWLNSEPSLTPGSLKGTRYAVSQSLSGRFDFSTDVLAVRTRIRISRHPATHTHTHDRSSVWATKSPFLNAIKLLVGSWRRE